MYGCRGEGISLAVILSGSIARYAVLPHIYIHTVYIICVYVLRCNEVIFRNNETKTKSQTGSEVNRRE